MIEALRDIHEDQTPLQTPTLQPAAANDVC